MTERNESPILDSDQVLDAVYSSDLLVPNTSLSIQPPQSYSQIHVISQVKGKSTQELRQNKAQFVLTGPCLPTRKQRWCYGVLSNATEQGCTLGKTRVKGKTVKGSLGTHRTVTTLTAVVCPCVGLRGVGGKRICLYIEVLLMVSQKQTYTCSMGHCPVTHLYWRAGDLLCLGGGGSCLGCYTGKCRCKPAWSFLAPTILI